MEHRFKTQRNRLFLRITLILLAVWLPVSAIYCVIQLHNEKINIQRQMLSNASYAKQSLSMGMLHENSGNQVYISNGNLLEFKDMIEKDYDSQMIVIDTDSGQVLADTADRVRVVYSFRTDKGTYPDDYGFLDFHVLRDGLTDAQYRKIAQWLRTDPGDGSSYALICSQFYAVADQIFPLTVSVIRTESESDRFREDAVVEDFPTGLTAPDGSVIFRNGENRLNRIPTDFLLDGIRNRDCIHRLTDSQREKNITMIPVGTAQYIVYISDYIFLNAFTFNDEKGYYEKHDQLYLMQYARQVNLLQSSAVTLAVGMTVISGIFLLTGTVLFLMIWHTTGTQIRQEQRRRDLTNALAHDIKTPLFIISGYAYSLKEDIDSGERDRYLDKIIEQTDRINALVHNMLNLSKLDSDQMTLTRTTFDLWELTEELLADYQKLPEGKTILTAHSGDSMISADRTLIRTALQNLIDNAVQYALPGSDIRIDVTEKTFRIANPCQPLTKAQQKAIWQPYYRIDPSRHHKGNGLGLSIVKAIFDLHGVRYELNVQDPAMFDLSVEWKDDTDRH
ncbi:MAG: HAMP domain-containing histidine kinase [Clostridia bacterium]|nr:HAMP domain-containing histidine kinase [Clostridia bacterium]